MKLKVVFVTIKIIVVFLSFDLYSQSRNEHVENFNQIIEMMNKFFTHNLNMHTKVVELQRVLSNPENKDISRIVLYPNSKSYILTNVNTSIYINKDGENYVNRLMPEVKINDEGFVSSFYTYFIPWLIAREKVHQLVNENKLSQVLITYLSHYLEVTEELYDLHKKYNEYILSESYKNDLELNELSNYLKTFQNLMNAALLSSIELEKAIQQEYYNQYQPLKTYPELQNGLKELDKMMHLLSSWREDVFRGDLSKNEQYHNQLVRLNEEGLMKDSLYFHNTQGYNYLNNGSFMHSLYRNFYTSMKGNIYWFAHHKYSKWPETIALSQKAYNKFILSYNQIVDTYNRYVAYSDGKTYENAYVCCPPRYERDTAVNVLLMRAKLLHKFDFPDDKNTIQEKQNLFEISKEDVEKSEYSEDELIIKQSEPHHMIYLLDISSSMMQKDKLTKLKEGTAYLVQLQRREDQISVVTFSGKSKIILEAVSCNEKEKINQKIQKIGVGGQTNFESGIMSVEKIIERNAFPIGLTKVVIISDGVFNLNKKVKKSISNIQKKSIQINFIHIGEQDKKFENNQGSLGNVFIVGGEKIKDVLIKIVSD